jgi:hypothetical protein
MEVHHHSKTARQHFWHYAFEFLMLFLAVSLGFLAENMREHDVENRREKQLMHSLLKDVRSDIIQIDSLKKRRAARNDSCDLLITLLSSAKANSAAIYYHGRLATRRIHFRPQDGTLQQLRNSGGFRVVHDTAVLNGINAYELALKANLENIEVEEKELSEYSQVAAKIFDVKIFQEMTKTDPITRLVGNPPLLNYDPLVLNELGIKLHYWKRTSVSAIENLESLRSYAVKLLKRIEEKYKLK